jgi:hypothetical protein
MRPPEILKQEAGHIEKPSSGINRLHENGFKARKRTACAKIDIRNTTANLMN